MNKTNDIYEHLAKVYFDSSNNRKKNFSFSKSLFKRKSVQLSILVIGCFFVFLWISIFARKPIPKSQISLILEPNTTRIDYDFNQAEKEAAIFDLKQINLIDFQALRFRARKSNYQDNLHICVEFVSRYGEKSKVYIKQIPTKWQNFKINLNEAKDISDWSGMQQLSFVLEKWNAQLKKGIVYIDNVEFLR